MKTHVIIDCGATSAKIAVIRSALNLADSGNLAKADVNYHKIVGFNPNHHDWVSFRDRIQAFFVKEKIVPNSLAYYGTGMTSSTLINRMTETLHEAIKLSREDISVNSDLLACAHAAYHGQPVIIGILGTGSNAGYFDGQVFERMTPSLGYLLGDEGSGVDIGKSLLRAFCYKQLPVELTRHMAEDLRLDLEAILERTYNKNDLRALASEVAPLGLSFYQFSVVQSLVDRSLAAYLKHRLVPEIEARPEATQIYLFGSVATAFNDQLKDMITAITDLEVITVPDPLQLLVEQYESKCV